MYPQPKRHRRNPVAHHSLAEEPPADQNYADTDVPASNLDFGVWDAVDATDLGVFLPDMTLPTIPTLPLSVADVSTQGAGLEGGNLSSPTHPWFLRDENWVMEHRNHDPTCGTKVELEPFILAVEEMLQFWVKNGHNGFIHRRLYEMGMPICVQDAFTTLSAYTARTPAVSQTILQIADERSSALIRQSSPSAGGAQNILGHLARVHALFVYVFIRLFDGSLRARASAEKHVPTLRRWVSQMWEASKQYRGEDVFSAKRQLQWVASEFDREYETFSALWRLWILTESVRRTQIIVDTIANVYETMTKGWADCTGAGMFTVRRGMWEAESTAKWFEVSCTNVPLLVPSLHPGPLMSEYTADEINDFAKALWPMIVGADKMQSWIDRSREPGVRRHPDRTQ